MARNGSGVYSLPAGSTVTNGDTSDATDLNTPLQDLETDMNTARPIVAGGTGATSAANARTNLGLAIGTDVQAQGAFLDTLSSQGNIQEADIADGSITTAKLADDAVSTAKIADGAVTDAKVANPSGLVFISSQDASSSSSLDFTGFDATKYDSYLLVIQNLIPSVTEGISIQLTTDGGSTWDVSSDYDFFQVNDPVSPRASSGGLILTGLDGGNPGTLNDVDSTGTGMSGTLKIYNPGLATRTYLDWEVIFQDGATAGSIRKVSAGGGNDKTTGHDGIRFTVSGGNFTSGTITLYGLRNS